MRVKEVEDKIISSLLAIGIIFTPLAASLWMCFAAKELLQVFTPYSILIGVIVGLWVLLSMGWAAMSIATLIANR